MNDQKLAVSESPVLWSKGAQATLTPAFKLSLKYYTRPFKTIGESYGTMHILQLQILEQSETLRKPACVPALSFVASNGFKIISDDYLCTSVYVPGKQMWLGIRGDDPTRDNMAVTTAYPDVDRLKHYYSSLLSALGEWRAAGYRWGDTSPIVEQCEPLPEYVWGE